MPTVSAFTATTVKTSVCGTPPESRLLFTIKNDSGFVVVKSRCAGQLMLKGISTAQAMSLSENAIAWHLRNLYVKLHASNRTSAVNIARQLRLL